MACVGASDTGVYAYCETPISDGWRIRFYSNWTWSDGPGIALVAFFTLSEAVAQQLGALPLSRRASLPCLPPSRLPAARHSPPPSRSLAPRLARPRQYCCSCQ